MRSVVSLKLMAQWSVFEAEAPELAEKIRARFTSHPHHVLGTVGSTGAPRLSGINIFFNDGVVWFGCMPASRKAADILRDSRIAVHSATLSEQLEGGDARISGVAVGLDPAATSQWRPENPGDGQFFGIDVLRAHVVEVEGEHLVVTMWDTKKGLRIVHRQ